MEKSISQAAQLELTEVFERASQKIRTGNRQLVERVHGDQDNVHAHDALVSKLLKQGKLDPRIDPQIHIYWVLKENFQHYVLLTRVHAIKWAWAISDPNVHAVCPLNPPRELWTAVTATHLQAALQSTITESVLKFKAQRIKWIINHLIIPISIQNYITSSYFTSLEVYKLKKLKLKELKIKKGLN
ncbi:hypothetical protein DFH28DRAFT_1197966 [Melampsora americana]|nr:hypothetical protein DFH28DRAFT_1197966 [Melampsora americana]